MFRWLLVIFAWLRFSFVECFSFVKPRLHSSINFREKSLENMQCCEIRFTGKSIKFLFRKFNALKKFFINGFRSFQNRTFCLRRLSVKEWHFKKWIKKPLKFQSKVIRIFIFWRIKSEGFEFGFQRAENHFNNSFN